MKSPARLFGALLSMSLLSILLCTLPACSGDSNEAATNEASTPASTSSDLGDPAEDTTADETTPAAPEYINPSVYTKDDAGAKSDTVLNAADYGVKGDGVTDDGPAISRAVKDAMDKQATLRFESGKTYRIETATNSASVFTSPFAMQDADGVTVDGGGSVFQFAPGLSFFVLSGSRDVRLSNMKFDCIESVYLVGTVKSVSGNTVTYTTDMEPYADQYDYSKITAFSIAYNEGTQERPHRFLTAMKKTASREVAVTYSNADHNYTKGDVVFLPNPGIGHVFSESIYIGHNEGAMTFENIEIRAASSFVSAIKGNDAEIYFENFDIMPGEDNDRAIKMVAWRDGFHCKDNRRPLHWTECDVGVIFDDVYNVSCTLGYITSVENGAQITVANYEFYTRGQRVAFDCRPGDVVDVYHPTENLFCGTATVRRVQNNADGTTTLTFDYGTDLKKMKEGCVVGNRETCAPGSTVTDCRFTGTFRALRNIRFERTTFDHLRTWIKVEGGVEGPLPGNIDFVDCTIRGGGIEIGGPGSQFFKQITDIGFWNCTFEGVKHEYSRTIGVTRSDTWTEAELYTVKNRKLKTPAVEVTPTATDMENGVEYDWTRYTMTVTGGKLLPAADLADEAIREKLLSSDNFSANILVLTGTEAQTRFVLGGLDSTYIPALHAKDAFHILTLDYYATGSGVSSVGIAGASGESALYENVFAESDRISRAAVLYYGAEGNTGLYINVPVGMTVYIGRVAVSTASATNPTDSQLEEGHTFLWSNHKGSEVTIGEGKALRVDEITDSKVKAAIKGADSGFASGMVLHLDRGFGHFTGLTDKIYYTPGRTYHLSLDAYIASAMKPTNGTKVYLIAQDDTAGNRVLAEGLFTGEGFYHFEMDWTVGNTGEYALTFYISNTPAAYPDVYIGDFTVTKAKPQKPDIFLSRDDYHTLTADEVKAGYTFDFSEGNLLNTGGSYYADMSTLRPETAKLLRENGFGDTVYYCNQNFTLQSLPNDLTGGSRICITLQVYDILGNLANSGSRGVFVLLHMQGGVQNSAEVSYKVTRSEADPRLLTLTFESTPPAGTDDLLLYSLTSMEFFIGSVTVKRG